MSGYTIVRLDDVPDPVADAPGARRFLSRPLETDQVALSYFRVAPGEQHGPPGMPGFGHHHKNQEEIYFVVSGTLTFKLDDDIVEVGPKTAVRIPPGMTRATRNQGSEDAELLICSVRVEDLRSEVELIEDFWPN